MNNKERVSIDWSDIPPERYDNNSYIGRLIISPLADSDDGTVITCTGTVTGGTETQSANSSDEVTVEVEGELTLFFL